MNDNTERSMSLKEEFLLTFLQEKDPAMPYRATGDASGFGQGTKDRRWGEAGVQVFMEVSTVKTRPSRVNNL